MDNTTYIDLLRQAGYLPICPTFEFYYHFCRIFSESFWNLFVWTNQAVCVAFEALFKGKG